MLKNRFPSRAIILLPLADSEAPGKSELTLRGGSSSPAEKLDHFLKLISPVYYQSERASLWNTAAGQEIYLSSICERLAVERLQLRILFTHDIPGR